MSAAEIRRISFTRFRAFQGLTWSPARGLNLLLGGGDVGKTTILEGVALLLNPANTYVLSDADYWNRDVSAEFEIEAIMSIPEAAGISKQNAAAWPWEWDGVNAVQPLSDNESSREPVYKVRVRGTADLELLYELMQPDGSAVSFPVGLRRGVGLIRLSSDERSVRDLRLVQGGGLDRLLADKTLRAKLGKSVASMDVGGEVSADAQQRLDQLDGRFAEVALPTGLGVGFVGGGGVSIGSLLGLTAERGAVQLPLNAWGAGTRRLAALTIADALTDDATPIIVVDELERGLEPYRQRRLVSMLQKRKSQCVVTTHSSIVIGAAKTATLWYIDGQHHIGSLKSAKVSALQGRDPVAFLARLLVVAEGSTEVGFLSTLFDVVVGPNWEDYGLHVADGGGNDDVRDLLGALSIGGLSFGGFVDRETVNPKPTKWAELAKRLGPLLMQWDKGCLEENVVRLFKSSQLESLATVADDHHRTSMRRRSLAERLKIAETSWSDITNAAGASLHQTIVEAATGFVPSDAEDESDRKRYKGHASLWFKSIDGGRELAQKCLQPNIWALLEPSLKNFLGAVCKAIGTAPNQLGGVE